MKSDAMRLFHKGTGQRFIVRDGHVYEDLDGDDRISQNERVVPAAHEPLAAAHSIAASFELSWSFEPAAVGDDEWICEGTLNSAELPDFEGPGVQVVRTALERHLDFFDIDTRDGIISLRENWRGWRRLGYGWRRALIGTLGAAIIFGRPLRGFGIDIARIQKKRRPRTSGLYDQRGDVNTGLLNACLAQFDARTRNEAGNADRDKPIDQADALQIIKKAAEVNQRELGGVSTRQFASLFDLCTRLNHGQKVITANQLASLFDGSLLYLAASMPGRDGRRRLSSPASRPPLIVELAVVFLAFACAPRPSDGHTWLQLSIAAAIVLGAWALSHFLEGRTAIERSVILSVGVLVAATYLGGLSVVENARVWPFIAAAAAIAIYQQRHPIVQHLVFCRYPLLLAATTMSLPIIAVKVAPTLFKSMLAMHAFGIAAVIMLTVLASEVFVNTASLIANQAPARFNNVDWTAPGTWIDRWAILLTAAIATPLALALVVYAETTKWWAAVGVAGGAAGAVLLKALVKAVGRSDAVKPRTDRYRRSLGRRLRLHPETVHRGYVESDGTLVEGHLESAVFLAITFGVYFAGYWVLMPGRSFHPPALAFVVFMLIVLGWLLPAVSFFTDKYRVSTLLALAAVPVLLYFINDIDHYFDVQVSSAQVTERDADDVRNAFSARLARSVDMYPAQQPVVIAVAAGGGGGSAAYWTTRVLAGLEQENGARFTDSIHMVSAVSGGSVGSLYFIDSQDSPRDGSVDPGGQWKKTLETARTSTLEPVAWGLAYPDLWRLFAIRPPNTSHDRGWAFEEALDRQLGHPGVRLSDWRSDMVAGKRPGVLFNATASETGERLVLSPLHFTDRNALTLEPVYGTGADLRASTAARLSATFPWVTPLAKARGRRPTNQTFHVGDGGYYDNAGLVTLVEWARQTVELARASGVKKMLFIDIGVTDPRPEMQNRAGWLYETIGPILTMMDVRGASQTSRNAVDVELFSQLRQTADIETRFVDFPLSTETSRSWRLSDADVRTIDEAWSCDGKTAGEIPPSSCKDVVKGRQQVRDFLAPSVQTQ